MIVSLGKTFSTQLATGKLERKGKRFAFRYDVVESRRFTREDPMEGLMNFRATMTIETNSNLNFVHGDKIYLDGSKKAMKVQNISTSTPKKGQHLYLKKPVEKKWTLDLV